MTSNLFPKEDIQTLLVRVDPIEAWAKHMYAVEAMPGFTIYVRRGVLCLCRDGRVAYVETWRVGLRLFTAKKWVGQVADLGASRPAPPGFV